MKKILVNKADSFEAAEKFDENYYSNMSSTERLEIVQILRESKNKGVKRLQRVVTIIK